jgi:hypothetical protein
MNENKIESYFKNKENNILMADKKTLSNMRYEVLNGKEKKSFFFHYRYAFATAFTIVSMVFSTNILNIEDINRNADVAYITSQEIATTSTFDKSILDWTIEDFNYAMIVDEYEENFLDYYL